MTETSNMGRDRLGKGLGALLGEYLEPEVAESDVRQLALESILYASFAGEYWVLFRNVWLHLKHFYK